MAFAQKAQNETKKVSDTKAQAPAPAQAKAKVDPKTELKAKTAPEPKVEQKTEAKAAPKVLTEVKVPEAPKSDDTKSATAPTNETDRKAEKEKWLKYTPETFWVEFGSEQIRGQVSRAIRHLDAIGLTRAEIAKVTGKRYQHVRNVLTEDAKAASAKTKQA